MRMIAHAIDGLTDIKNPKANWLDDPYLFQQAKLAVNAALDLFAPRDPLPPDVSERGPHRQGLVAIHELLREIQVADATTPRAKQTTRERVLAMLKSDLGALADQPRAYGKSAARLRVKTQSSTLNWARCCARWPRALLR